MKTLQANEIGGGRAIPNLEKIDPRLFYEVDLLDAVVEPEFSHSLGRRQSAVWGEQKRCGA